MVFIIPIIIGLIIYAIISAGVRAPGNALGRKFQSLGQMEGKTLDEICAVVGQPISTAAMGNGKTLYQWSATGFHVAILFEGQAFAGIASVHGANVS